jgi:hypothetical protein
VSRQLLVASPTAASLRSGQGTAAAQGCAGRRSGPTAGGSAPERGRAWPRRQGGGLGLALAEALRRLALVAIPAELPLPEGAGLDGRVLAVTTFLSLGSALLFGIAPGLLTAGGPLTAALRQDARGGTSRGLKRALRGFAIAQFAGALVLLTASGLLLRSFAALVATDPGFQPRQAVALSTTLPERGYPKRSDICRRGQTAPAASPASRAWKRWAPPATCRSRRPSGGRWRSRAATREAAPRRR